MSNEWSVRMSNVRDNVTIAFNLDLIEAFYVCNERERTLSEKKSIIAFSSGICYFLLLTVAITL